MSDAQHTVAADLQAIVDAQASVEGAATLLRGELPQQGLVWRHVAGGITRGGEPAQVDTTFRIASITKTFTAAVITQLAAEGLLKFDDLLSKHLPPEHLDLIPRLHVLDGASYGEEITLRQLLTHSAGLFDYASAHGFFAAIAADPGHVWTPREMLEGSIVWGTPHFRPGGGYGYAYSDTGYVLLGLVIEHLDRTPLHESYRRRILTPLGMSITTLEGHEAHRGPTMSHPHEGDLDAAVIHGTADWAGGGLVSDVDELAVFAQALVGGRIVAQPCWTRCWSGSSVRSTPYVTRRATWGTGSVWRHETCTACCCAAIAGTGVHGCTCTRRPGSPSLAPSTSRTARRTRWCSTRSPRSSAPA